MKKVWNLRGALLTKLGDFERTMDKDTQIYLHKCLTKIARKKPGIILSEFFIQYL